MSVRICKGEGHIPPCPLIPSALKIASTQFKFQRRDSIYFDWMFIYTIPQLDQILFEVTSEFSYSHDSTKFSEGMHRENVIYENVIATS